MRITTTTDASDRVLDTPAQRVFEALSKDRTLAALPGILEITTKRGPEFKAEWSAGNVFVYCHLDEAVDGEHVSVKMEVMQHVTQVALRITDALHDAGLVVRMDDVEVGRRRNLRGPQLVAMGVIS